jgi:hypothetical protein
MGIQLGQRVRDVITPSATLLGPTSWAMSIGEGMALVSEKRSNRCTARPKASIVDRRASGRTTQRLALAAPKKSAESSKGRKSRGIIYMSTGEAENAERT